MTIENALDTYLKADVTLATLVSTRIYWMKADQTATVPYVVYSNIGDTDAQYSFGDNDTGLAKIQFDVVSSDKAKKTAMYRIRTLMRGISGTCGGITILHSLPAGISERFNNDTQKYIFTCTYDIAYHY